MMIEYDDKDKRSVNDFLIHQYEIALIWITGYQKQKKDLTLNIHLERDLWVSNLYVCSKVKLMIIIEQEWIREEMIRYTR